MSTSAGKPTICRSPSITDPFKIGLMRGAQQRTNSHLHCSPRLIFHFAFDGRVHSRVATWPPRESIMKLDWIWVSPFSCLKVSFKVSSFQFSQYLFIPSTSQILEKTFLFSILFYTEFKLHSSQSGIPLLAFCICCLYYYSNLDGYISSVKWK